MKIGCVIVTYNIGKDIIKTYEAIKEQVEKIIFVDNNSDDITKISIEKICKDNKECLAIFNDNNYGIAEALNLGIKELLKEKFDFILTLDQDSIAEENMIKKMLMCYDSLKLKYNIGIISPAIYDINKRDFLVNVNNQEYEIINEPIQSGSLIRTELFDTIGYYNNDLFIYYVDTDFCYKALQYGYKCIQCNTTILKHEEGKKSIHKVFGKNIFYNNYSNFAIYYRARNNICMMYKYRNMFTSKDRVLKDLIKIVLFDKNKYLSVYIHLKGILDGIKSRKIIMRDENEKNIKSY